MRGGRGGGEGSTATRFVVGVDMAVATGRTSWGGIPSLFHSSTGGMAGQFLRNQAKSLRRVTIITIMPRHLLPRIFQIKSLITMSR